MSFKFESSYDGLISRADLKKLFWRSIPYEHSWNYERMGHIGFMWALMPILRKLYPQDADFKAALKRHMELYNVTPYISTLPMSIAAAMEEVNATDDSFDTSAISNVKLALMGPLSGVGDAFYWGTLRILATGVGTSLALQGSILGPILFLLVFNVPHYIIRYLLTFVGYRFGSDMISKVQESGIMDTIVKMASIMGAMVIGAMTMEMVTVDIPLMVGAGDGAQTLAELLNGIFPGFVTMGLFGIVYLMLKKKMNPLVIMLVILLVEYRRRVALEMLLVFSRASVIMRINVRGGVAHTVLRRPFAERWTRWSIRSLPIMNISHRYFDLEEFFSSAAASGYTCCELWTGAMHLYVDCHGYDSLGQVRELSQRYGVRIVGLCPEQNNPKPWNIAARGNEARARTLAYFKNVVDIAAELGAEQVMVSSGWAFLNEPIEDAWGRSASMLRAIAEHAGERGVRLVSRPYSRLSR